MEWTDIRTDIRTTTAGHSIRMFDVVVAAAVLVIGSLLVVQGFIMRQCFQVGQPNSNSHFSNEVLTNEGKDE